MDCSITLPASPMIVSSATPGRIARNLLGSVRGCADVRTDVVAIKTSFAPYQEMCLIRPNLTRKTATRARTTAHASSEKRFAPFVSTCVLMLSFLNLNRRGMGLPEVVRKYKKPTHIPVSGFEKN